MFSKTPKPQNAPTLPFVKLKLNVIKQVVHDVTVPPNEYECGLQAGHDFPER